MKNFAVVDDLCPIGLWRLIFFESWLQLVVLKFFPVIYRFFAIEISFAIMVDDWIAAV